MTSIANGESGSSVRTKLNAALLQADALQLGSRAALVSLGSYTNGALYSDGEHLYRGSTGATAIPDMDGLVPVAPYNLAQWGVVPETNTGQKTSSEDWATEIQAAIDWMQENGGGVLSAGTGVIAFNSTIYMGDGTYPVLLVGEGRGITGAGKTAVRASAATRFLWGGSATVKSFVLTSDRTNGGEATRNGGGGVLDIMFDGAEIGTAATSIPSDDVFGTSCANGGWLFNVISHSGHHLRLHLAYRPGGCFLSTCLSNGLASGPADTQRGVWDIWTSDANTAAEPYAHVLITGSSAQSANTSLMESISMNLRPESTAVAMHIEFSDGSWWPYIDASTRATKSGDGGRVIFHADDTLTTYHGGAYTSQGHARRHAVGYEQIKSGVYALQTIAGTNSSGPNTIHTHSKGNGAPAPTVEKKAILNYWDEEVGLHTNDFLTVREFDDTTSITHGIKLEKISTAGTVGMGLAKIQWRFTNDAGTQDIDAGRFNAVVRDPAAGAEDVRIGVVPMWGGVENQTAMYWENGVVVPDGTNTTTAQGFGTVNVAQAVHSPGWKSFASRADLAAFIAVPNTPVVGAIYSDGTVQYVGQAGATVIPDLPGLVPFGTPTLAHWPDTSAGQAEALTYAAAQTWSIPPWVIETVDEVRHDLYTEASGTEDAYAAIQINDSTDATHVGEARSSLSIISRPYGSGANGGANADWGMSVSVIKKGYAGGSAQPGAFNGIQVICRQDGQDAPSLSDPLRSDVAAFIANTTVVGESGWNGVLEATSTRLNRSGFTVAEQIQTQVGSISPNSGSIFSRGFTTIAKAGTLTCAFYAGEDGGTWGKYLEIPNKVLVGPSGIDWSQNTRITAVGTIQVTTTNSSAITFATNNTNRWSIGSGGSLLPSTDLGVNIGSASFKVNTIYAAGIILSGNNQQMNGLPVYADNAAAISGGLAAGRVYRTATGELRIVV